MPKRNAKKEHDRLFIAGLAKRYQRERLGERNEKEEFYEEIFRAQGKLLPGEHIVIEGGMPTWRTTPEYGDEIIIDSEVDIRNELVLQQIEAWQKEIIKKINPPPKPQIMSGSRRKDWRPLQEWAMMHPQFTIKEIAEILDCNYTQLKRAL